eukprot:s2478_g2.t1
MVSDRARIARGEAAKRGNWTKALKLVRATCQNHCWGSIKKVWTHLSDMFPHLGLFKLEDALVSHASAEHGSQALTTDPGTRCTRPSPAQFQVPLRQKGPLPHVYCKTDFGFQCAAVPRINSPC